LKIQQFMATISIGDKLKDLIDDQTVHVRINWQEFCQRVLDVVHAGRNLVLEEGELSIKPWISELIE
ncbi:MAG: hypothetical protein OEZ02_05190, partial [Anaerolineae bacterium]|nr:hypothetical protein [Anaerolineae bacterium]